MCRLRGGAHFLDEGESGRVVEEDDDGAVELERAVGEELTDKRDALAHHASGGDLGLGGTVADDLDDAHGPVEWAVVEHDEVAADRARSSHDASLLTPKSWSKCLT